MPFVSQAQRRQGHTPVGVLDAPDELSDEL